MKSLQICPFEHSSIETKVLRIKARETQEDLALCHVLTGCARATVSSSTIPHLLVLRSYIQQLERQHCNSIRIIQSYWLAFGILNNAVFDAFLRSVMKHLKGKGHILTYNLRRYSPSQQGMYGRVHGGCDCHRRALDSILTFPQTKIQLVSNQSHAVIHAVIQLPATFILQMVSAA